MIRLRPVFQSNQISLRLQELPDLAEMKRRWMHGEHPLGLSKKKLKHRAKTKMELRRIRKRLEKESAQ